MVSVSIERRELKGISEKNSSLSDGGKKTKNQASEAVSSYIFAADLACFPLSCKLKVAFKKICFCVGSN